MADAPDFRPTTPAVNPNAFAQAQAQRYEIEMQQQKAEDERKNSRISRILDAVTSGQQIASNMMKMAEQNMKNSATRKALDGQEKVTGILKEPTSVVPSGDPKMDAIMQSRFKEDRNARLLSALNDQAPETVAKALVKTQIGDPTDDVKRFQQSAIQVPDEDGIPQTVATTFDTKTGQQINPMTGKPLVTEDDAKGLLKRGYAQSTRAAGFDEEGREVVADARSGAKFIVSVDPETGKQTREKYNGKIYPKLDNPPATFTAAMTELGNAGQLLEDITKSFDPQYVGPVAARAGKMTKYVEALTEPQRVEFYGNVAEYKNSIIKAITGAQMSEQEAARIIQQIPDENASPTAFMAGVKRAYTMTNRRLSQMDKAIQRSGGVTRGDAEKPIGEEELDAMISKKLGKMAGKAKPAMSIDKAALAAELKKRGL